MDAQLRLVSLGLTIHRFESPDFYRYNHCINKTNNNTYNSHIHRHNQNSWPLLPFLWDTSLHLRAVPGGSSLYLTSLTRTVLWILTRCILSSLAHFLGFTTAWQTKDQLCDSFNTCRKEALPGAPSPNLCWLQLKNETYTSTCFVHMLLLVSQESSAVHEQFSHSKELCMASSILLTQWVGGIDNHHIPSLR